MEVDDFELLELVNDYQERSDEPTFNTLDDIPEALIIEALDEANYIKESLITPENGFKLIETLEAGMSPLSVVYQRDLEYEKLMNKSNEIQG